MADTELSDAALRRLASTREWAVRGKRRLYQRDARMTGMDIFFAAKRAYGAAQRIPIIGGVATGSARLARRLARGGHE